jgi:cytochrome c peroxidase
MHNGYFKTLRHLVAFYNDRDARPAGKGDVSEADARAQGCWPKPEIRRNLNTDEIGKLGLSEPEIDDIVAFMRTLNYE